MRIENERIMEERRKVFIEDARKKYGDKFDYSKVGLISGILTKVVIGCQKHGDFIQSVYRHLHTKYGCKECSKELRSYNIDYKRRKFPKKYKLKESRWELNPKTRICSECKIEIHYKTKASFKKACKKGSPCNRCASVIKSNYFINLKTVPFNRNACKFIDKINNRTGWELQHALNGGELKIDRLKYWLDGYDKKRKIIFEYDEPFHYDETGNLKKRDVERQTRIIKLMNPIYFIRYDEKRNRLYEVLSGKEVMDYGKKEEVFN